MECNICGNQLDFIVIKGVAVSSKTGEIWIHEKWECLECGNLEIRKYLENQQKL